MASAEEDQIWHGIDHQLNSSLLGKITSIIECSVCSETMHVPFTTECGHTFCYECLSSWLQNKLNCPTCRHELSHKPVMNIQLKEIARSITDLLIETRSSAQESTTIRAQRDECVKAFEYDLKHHRLFGELFQSALTFLDTSDGVPRCGNCHWEANGSVCLHCGTRFRTPHEEDEEEEYYSNDEEHPFYTNRSDLTPVRGSDEDEYDSADSFMDNRAIEEISRDLRADPDDDILSSDASERDWEGFNDAEEVGSDSDSGSGTELSPINIEDQDDEFAYYDSDELRDALEEFHDGHLQEANQVDDEGEIRPTRSRRVHIVGSSGEEDD